MFLLGKVVIHLHCRVKPINPMSCESAQHISDVSKAKMKLNKNTILNLNPKPEAAKQQRANGAKQLAPVETSGKVLPWDGLGHSSGLLALIYVYYTVRAHSIYPTTLVLLWTIHRPKAPDPPSREPQPNRHSL